MQGRSGLTKPGEVGAILALYRLESPSRAHHTCKKQGDWRHDRGDFQQLHRDMFQEKCCFFASFKKKLHLKCAFANILLISFIFNFEFMFCTCIIVVDLIFVDFWYYSFRIEIYKIFITLKFEFPPFVSIKMPPCLKLDKLIAYLWKSYI